MTPIIVIAGPTATQKSSLAIKLAQKINGIIINADSRQIYKELKIGTAQPQPEKVKENVWFISEVPHYLYGNISINKELNLYKYQKLVQNIISKTSKPIILVGGTGLYIDAIVQGYKLEPNQNSLKRKYLEKLSINELWNLIPTNKLNQLNNSDKNNPRRLIRFIERKYTRLEKSPIKHLYCITSVPNKEIYIKRLKKRINAMINQGLENEIKNLLQKTPNLWELSALNTIGYKEFKPYFEGKIDIKTVKENILQHTKQYSKRQETWFKRNSSANIINNINDLYQLTKNFLNSF